MSKTLPTLYKKDTKGKLRHWTVEVSDEGYRAVYGQDGGKTTTSKWYKAEATNVGRANERNVAQQALFEAEAVYKKKIDSGFRTSIDDVGKNEPIKPMLADKWEVRKDKISFPVFSQPKLDGMRAVISKDGAFTRNGKSWVTIPHILEELKEFFVAHPDAILDGELYNHEYKEDFNKICSLAKKTKPTEKDLAESAEKLQYWVYDIIDVNTPFGERFLTLTKNLEKNNLKSVKIVPTLFVHSESELDSYYEEYLTKGYEGQMIRLNEVYQNKRSKFLLKRKDFQDAEYRIVEVCEGNGNKEKMAGYMILERERWLDGNFRSNIKGSHAFLTDLLAKKEELKGKWATVQYFNLTPDGVPRFPYVIKIRDGKGID